MKNDQTIIQKMLDELTESEQSCDELQKSFNENVSLDRRVYLRELYDVKRKEYNKTKLKLINKFPVKLNDLITEMLKLLNNKTACLKMLGIIEPTDDMFDQYIHLTENTMNNVIIYTSYKNILARTYLSSTTVGD